MFAISFTGTTSRSRAWIRAKIRQQSFARVYAKNCGYLQYWTSMACTVLLSELGNALWSALAKVGAQTFEKREQSGTEILLSGLRPRMIFQKNNVSLKTTVLYAFCLWRKVIYLHVYLFWKVVVLLKLLISNMKKNDINFTHTDFLEWNSCDKKLCTCIHERIRCEASFFKEMETLRRK